VKLLAQGVEFYEGAVQVVLKGGTTRQELHKSTGWTEEHYEYFHSRLRHERDAGESRRKFSYDRKGHANQVEIHTLRNSL
jgi:hypothetical protein